MTRNAFTLVEMVLVLVILVALAAILIPLLGGFEIATPGGTKSDKQIATEAAMQAIRNAIMGTSAQPGAWPDLGQRPEMFPHDPSLLLLNYHQVASLHPQLPRFDPVTRLGWRGPYLSGPTRLVDAWGHPLVIQVGDVNANGQLDDEDVRYARLVSAGPDGILDTADSDGYVPGDNVPAIELSLAECGDDIVSFFRVSDTRE